jgi:hypothetical protein
MSLFGVSDEVLLRARPLPETIANADKRSPKTVPSEIIRELVLCTHPDLMQAEEFVVDQPIVHLEAAHPHQETCQEGGSVSGSKHLAIAPQAERAAEQQASRQDLENPVTEDLPAWCGMDVEVMPLQELMEGNGIDRAHRSGSK